MTQSFMIDDSVAKLDCFYRFEATKKQQDFDMEICIRNIKQWVVEFHQREATKKGMTLEEHIIDLLAQIALAHGAHPGK